jgi:hypothetical protein
MRFLYAVLFLAVAGCGRSNPDNYSCSPVLLDQLDAKATACARDSKVICYAECLRNLKTTFCKYEE